LEMPQCLTDGLATYEILAVTGKVYYLLFEIIIFYTMNVS